VNEARALKDAPMPPTFWESVLLGAIQGVCGLLPISASGHLALADMLFGVSSRGVTFEVWLGFGMLLAVLVVLRSRIKAALVDGLAALRQPSLFSTTPGARDALVMLLAAVPSALASFTLRHVVERFGQAPLAVGLGFLVTAAILLAAHFAKPGRAEQPGVVGALAMGVAQGVAALPGLSPIAATLTVALLFGVRRERAFELGLLVTVPVAVAQPLVLALGAPQVAVAPELVGPAAVACVMAFLTGVAALWLLRRSVAAGRLSWFAGWLVPVSLATLALAKAWPHG
jgi:undecaprenyl-diphosphatase